MLVQTGKISSVEDEMSSLTGICNQGKLNLKERVVYIQ